MMTKIARPFGPILKSMGEIERFTGRDADTLRRLVEEAAFPAKLVAGRWQAVVEDVLTWYRQRTNDR